MSPDFRAHSVAISFGGLLAAHDRVGFDWIGYSIAAGGGDMTTERLGRSFTAFRDLGALANADAARLIYDDQIDILVDLAGHTRGTRLEVFALEPAPVQVHCLGYGSTVGADYIP